MIIKLDGIIDSELKEFLLSQDGITDVDINYDDKFINVNIKFNKKLNPLIIMKYIELFEDNKYPNLVEFNKEYEGKTKKLKYIVDDMCCSYCYEKLAMDLFENDKIQAVKSNFNFKNPAFNIEFLIEYSEDYNEEDLIKYIKDNYS